MEPKETQDAFAARAGLPQPTVNDWLNGAVTTPKRASAEMAARKLNVHPDWLRAGKGPYRPYPKPQDKPEGEQMADSLAFARHLDQIGDITGRYDTLAVELETLINDCDARKEKYQAMLAELHRVVEREMKQKLPTK